MPRSKEKIKRPQPSSEIINAAVTDIVKNKMSLRAAEDKYNVSKSALARHVMTFKKCGSLTYEYTPHYDTNKVFSVEQENILVEYLKQCSFLNYGLTILDLRKLAFQYAKENKINYPPTWDNDQRAGEGWARWFRSRHAEAISLRKPESTSLSRATSFNKENVSRFFNNYSTVLGRHNFEPARIYNTDETGISTVHNPPKIITQKGVKAVGGMTSGERGVNVTMIAAINAIGNSVPPMFVFPRVHFKDHMLKGAPPGSIGAAAPSGWSNEIIFLQFLQHFISHVKPSPTEPVILVMDNHESHISVPTISLAKNAGVIMMTFHPHTSHKMQPLDRTVFGPFKAFYHKAVAEWMVTPGNQGKPITIYDVAEVAGKAYPLSFTPANIVKGFQVTGLFPLNPEIFQDYEFLPSNVTDRPDPATAVINQPTTNLLINQDASQIIIPLPNSPSHSNHSLSSNFPQTSISNYPLTPATTSTCTIVTPEDIRPFPKAEARKQLNTRKCRPKGKSRILTDTPEKMEIEKAKQDKLETKGVKLKKKKVRLNFRKSEMRKQSSKQDSSSDFSESDLMQLCDDSSDDLADILEEHKILAKELESDFNTEQLKADDYVLVEFQGKKSVKYFVAKVVEAQNNIVFVVEYLKKCLDSDKFKIEKDTKLFEVNVEDIKLKLPAPGIVGGTKRRAKQLMFPVSFAGYNLG